MSSATTERRRRSLPSGPLVFALLVLLFILAAGWVKGLVPDLSNPFTTQTIDRSGPAVLQAVADLGEYRAASGHFEVIVDVEEDVRFVPAAIKGERVLFVAVGQVDAVVDFRTLDDDAVRVSADRLSATITLPAARFADPQLDTERSYVYERERGALDRIASVFQDSPTGERELYAAAQRKLLSAAQSGSGILARAEQNTRLMLQGLLRTLGFGRVVVRFADDPS